MYEMYEMIANAHMNKMIANTQDYDDSKKNDGKNDKDNQGDNHNNEKLCGR